VVPAGVGHGVEAQTLLHLVPGAAGRENVMEVKPGRQGADDESFSSLGKLAATAPPLHPFAHVLSAGSLCTRLAASTAVDEGTA
jgi:hypothetical protein